MEWFFRRANRERWKEKMEEERRGDWGNPTSGFQSDWTRLTACESLCDRISFISYWCYFVLSGLPYACNGNLGALRRGQMFVWCVCGSTCVCVCVLCAQSSCFRQYLYDRPPLHPLHSLSVSTFVQSVGDLKANLLKYLCIFQSVFFCSLA